MVRRARIISWTPFALNSKQEIFSYWNNRNKSKIYSQNINIEFRKALLQVDKIPEIEIQTDVVNVRLTFFIILKLFIKFRIQKLMFLTFLTADKTHRIIL